LGLAGIPNRQDGSAVMGKRILLIDDEEVIREVTQLSLEIVGGWEVLTARSGTEGLAIASAEQPDAILLDMVMPDMDGATTLERLQANCVTQAIPVILLTAKLQSSDPRWVTDLGAAGFIAKPFDALNLARQVAEALGWQA
jgi:CheY-like chemotaxis protein